MQQAQLSFLKISALAASVSLVVSLLVPLTANSCPKHEGAETSSSSSSKSDAGSKEKTSDNKTLAPAGGKNREGFNQPLVLSGLKQMKLVIGELDAVATEHGITKEKIRHLVVDELVPTHATICDDGDCCSGKGCEPSATPILYLKLKAVADSAKENSKDAKDSSANFSINMSLVEKVKVPRNKQELMVAVWSKDASGSGDGNLQNEVDDQLKEVVKHFRRDFALANSADIGHGKKHPLKKDNPSGMPDEQD